MPDWFNLNVAGVIAAVMAGAAALKAHVSARHEIADQSKRIERIEKEAADREERLRIEFKRELDGAVSVLGAKLESHAKDDSRMAGDIAEVKKAVNSIWGTVGRMDKALSALNAKLEK